MDLANNESLDYSMEMDHKNSPPKNESSPKRQIHQDNGILDIKNKHIETINQLTMELAEAYNMVH